jgi:Bacterial aa3 type cytochrome c oxidase subunit IV
MAEHNHGNVPEHKVGSMDIRAQEKTFAAFIRFSIWGAVISVAVLIIMALSNA